MNPDDIVGIVERIAELLTPGVQRAWEIAVRQANAQAIAYLVWAVVGIIVAVVAAIFLVRVCRVLRREKSAFYDGIGMEMAATGLAVLVFAVLLVAGCNLNNAILYLVNPEYQAIRILLGLVGR